MNYLKALAFNFLIVFFANHVLPGVLVMDQTKLPHIGGDLIMAIALGVLNTLIYPVLRLIKHESALKIAIVALILNFVAYAILKIVPIGISVINIQGYLIASAVVAIGSFLINFFEMKHQHKTMENFPQ